MISFIADHFKETYTIYTSRNGKDGWETAQKLIPDIIISDVMMPEMKCIEFCNLIKIDPKTWHNPMILFTARSTKVGIGRR